MLTPRLTVKLLSKRVSSFHYYGTMGFIVGTILGVLIGNQIGLSVPMILGLSLTGACVFFILAFGAKWITGEEVIVYYHHEIAILLVCMAELAILDMPILAYLDITMLGIATFLAFGRIGCYNVGCCHGLPARHGVVYTHEHVEAGFTFYYQGIRLFPVQLVESAFVFLLILVGSILLLAGYAPGTFLALYSSLYGLFRFVIELFRGDPERPYWLGLSEAQWTTLILMSITIIFCVIFNTPFYGMNILAGTIILITTLILLFQENRIRKIFRPRHILQIASALQSAPDAHLKATKFQHIPVYQTNLKLKLSKGQFQQDKTMITHYTLSCCKDQQLTPPTVQRMASLIKQLQEHSITGEVQEGKNGTFHILFREPGIVNP